MNPYERLLAQIEEWDKVDGSIGKQRFAGKQGINRWGTLREAARTLTEVSDLLDAEEDGDLLIDALWEYFIQPSRSWTNSNGSQKISRSDLAHLRTQSKLHETTPMASRKLSESEVEMLKETLGELKEEIIELGQSLGAAGARFILLIDSCLTLLTDEDADPAVVRAKAEQLIGSAAAMGPFIPAPHRESVISKVWRLIAPWAGNTSSGAAGNMLAEAFRNGELPPGA